VRSRSYASWSLTPEGRVNHKRTNLGLISAITNKGELLWMVLDNAIKARSLLRFLARLVWDSGQKVFLILDRLPVHRSAKVRAWLTGREAAPSSAARRRRTARRSSCSNASSRSGARATRPNHRRLQQVADGAIHRRPT
jgi:hypothetical protein